MLSRLSPPQLGCRVRTLVSLLHARDNWNLGDLLFDRRGRSNATTSVAPRQSSGWEASFTSKALCPKLGCGSCGLRLPCGKALLMRHPWIGHP